MSGFHPFFDGGRTPLQHSGGNIIPDAVTVKVPAEHLLRVDGLHVVVYRMDGSRQLRVP